MQDATARAAFNKKKIFSHAVGSIVFFLKRFITQTVCTKCTRINYKIVPVTNFSKYVLYGTSGNE